MKPIDVALARHTEGFNCSQSVLAAFAEEIGLPLTTALRLASPFGGGVGRRGEVCGAATGALLALGMRFDRGTTDKEGKEATYVMAAEFLRRFEAATGQLLCRDLIGYDLSRPEELAAAREAKVFSTTCHGIVATATQLAAEMLQLPQRRAV